MIPKLLVLSNHLTLRILGGARKVVSCAERRRSSEAANSVVLAEHLWGVSVPCSCVYRKTMRDTRKVCDEYSE